MWQSLISNEMQNSNVNRGQAGGAGYNIQNAIGNIGNRNVQNKKKRAVMNVLDFGGGLSQTLGLTNKDEDYELPALQRYKMPQETEAGGYSLPILKRRASGEGVAFDPETLNQMQTPYAKSAWSDWQTKMKPQIEEMWATKGLGRSSMAGQAEIQAQSDILNDIGLNWSELNKWNEALKQQGIQSGLAGLSSYMGSELNQGNLNTAQDNQQLLDQYYIDEGMEQARNQQGVQQGQQQMGIIGNILSAVGNNQNTANKQNTGLGTTTSPQTLQVTTPRSAYTINNSGYNTQFLNNDALRNRYRYLLS